MPFDYDPAEAAANLDTQRGPPRERSDSSMKHDVDNAVRGAVIGDAGKTRVNMYIDNDIVEHFRALATSRGRGYQTEINAALRQVMLQPPEALAVPAQRRIRLLDEAGKDVLVDIAARMRVLEHRAGIANTAALAVADTRAEYVVEVVEAPRRRGKAAAAGAAKSAKPAGKARAPAARKRVRPSASKGR
jgi:uncharacterized protein (DUF4415 family)